MSDGGTGDDAGDGSGAADRRSGCSETPPVVPGTEEAASPLGRVLEADAGPLLVLRETGVSALAVLAVGLLLFGVSGVWPPMVAVESGSMTPHMQKGDLVFVTEPGRYAPAAATTGDTGVVTYRRGVETGYRSFGDYGSVVVYDDPGRIGPPIIHRARFHVEAGENWYGRANKEYVAADSCEELRNCPADHAGFITKGDSNARYDQAMGISEPVRAEWVTGVARIRVPLLGWIRLWLTGVGSVLTADPAAATAPAGADAGMSAVDGARPTPNGAVAGPAPASTNPAAPASRRAAPAGAFDR